MIPRKKAILLSIFIVINNASYAQEYSVHSNYIKPIEQSDLEKLEYDSKHGIVCGICLETSHDLNLCYKTRCQSSTTRPHIFHKNCILEWIKTGSNICPSCNCSIDIDKDFIDAVRIGSLDLVKKLISNGANINIQDNNGENALAIAILKGYKDLTLLLIENGADICFKNKNGVPILIYASYKGNLNITKLLIDKGVDVNDQDNFGNTALIIACFKGHLNIVELLIENGADIHITNTININALESAILGKHKDIIETIKNRFK